METKRFNVAAEIKAVDDSGVIEGYGSVFGNLDSYSDIVAPGAFAKSLEEAKASGRMPAMLWQHNPDEPIGVWTSMREDAKGLYVKGQLADTQRGREALALIKMGALTGLSIGYSTVRSEFDNNADVRFLTDVDLWEVSPVTFPANDRARITAAKSADIKTRRDFEGFLRDAGFSRADAKRIASHGFEADQRDADDASNDDLLKVIEAARTALAG
jgi:HK97 family phage prohead protease